MQKVDLNEGGVELPVWLINRNDDIDEGKRGFWISFEEPEALVPVLASGPYSTREDALTAAGRVAHEAVRAQATEELLSQNQGH